MGLERARREKQMIPLEKAVLPLLSARLPRGAEALGVSSSSDGKHLRMFVQLCNSSEAAAEANRAAAATVAVGALLGCETELLVSFVDKATQDATKAAKVEENKDSEDEEKLGK